MTSNEKNALAGSVIVHSIAIIILIFFEVEKKEIIFDPPLKEIEIEFITPPPINQRSEGSTLSGTGDTQNDVSEIGKNPKPDERALFKKRDSSRFLQKGHVDAQVNNNIDSRSTGLTASENFDFNLSGRKLLFAPKISDDTKLEGKVVVTIIVNKSGKVISTTPGAKGTTTSSPKLWEIAKNAATKFWFDSSPSYPDEQKGAVSFRFVLR